MFPGSARVHQPNRQLASPPDIRTVISFPEHPTETKLVDQAVMPVVDTAAFATTTDDAEPALSPVMQVTTRDDAGVPVPTPLPTPHTDTQHHHYAGHARSPRPPPQLYIPPAEEDMVRDIDTLKLCGSLRRYYVKRTPMIGILTGFFGESEGDRANRPIEDPVLGHARERQVIGGLKHLNIPRPPFLVQVQCGVVLLLRCLSC